MEYYGGVLFYHILIYIGLKSQKFKIYCYFYRRDVFSISNDHSAYCLIEAYINE